MAYRIEHQGARVLVQGSYLSFMAALRSGQRLRAGQSVLKCPETGRCVNVVVHAQP